MLEYINQLRARGYTVADAAVEGAVLRLRPIMMTMLVATLGLLPAAMSHAIGSDSQRPFAIVIVGGLMAALALSIFLLPTLYVWIAREGDKLPEPEAEESFEHLRALFIACNSRTESAGSPAPVACAFGMAFVLAQGASAQQALTWDQVKAKFEASNPASQSRCRQRR